MYSLGICESSEAKRMRNYVVMLCVCVRERERGGEREGDVRRALRFNIDKHQQHQANTYPNQYFLPEKTSHSASPNVEDLCLKEK